MSEEQSTATNVVDRSVVRKYTFRIRVGQTHIFTIPLWMPWVREREGNLLANGWGNEVRTDGL